MYTTCVIIFLLVLLLGIGFTTLLPKSLPNFLKIIAAFAIGLFIFGQITLLSAFVLNINFFSILLSFFIYSGLSAFFFFKDKNAVNLRFAVSPIFVISTIFIASLSAYIFFNQVLAQKNFGLVTGGGGIYGDTALHSAYTSRLVEGGFPPQNPLYAGKVLVYPLANDLLSAILRLNQMTLNLSFVLPQLIFMLGFLSIFYTFCRKFMSDKGYLFSLIFLFFGWGIGWFFFLREWIATSIPFFEFIKNDFTNNETYNLHFHNIFTGLIWPERSFLPGIFLAVWSYLNFLWYEETSEKKYLLVNSLILGSLPFWHTHTFIFIAISSAVFFGRLLFNKFSEKLLREILLFGVVSVALAAPFIWLFLTNSEDGSFFHFSLGWMNKNENIIVYWFKNSFLIIPLAVGGFFFVKKKYLYVYIPSVLVFVLANIVIFQPWDWDNIKLLTLSFILFSAAAGILFDHISKKNLIAFTILLLTIPFFTLSGFLSVALQSKNIYTIYDNSDIDLANWAEENTKPNEVFLINPIPNHPIPGLAGRLVYMGYPGHLWVHGINYAKREQEVNQILSGDFSPIENLEEKITYIVLSNNTSGMIPISGIQESYQNQKYRVLMVTD